MGFYFNNDNENYKQYFNFNNTVFDCIINDMSSFGEDKITTFINRIIISFYNYACASYSVSIKRSNSVREKVLGIKEDERRGNIKKLRLRKDTIQLLTEDRLGVSALYDESLTDYLNALFVEYASLPYVERELIYFIETAERIMRATTAGKVIHITNGENRFVVKPYKIIADKNTVYNYLTGYSKEAKNEKSSFVPASFRLSRIRADEYKISHPSGRLKDIEVKELLEKIICRGVQFLIGSEGNIKVKLTNNGIKQYNDIIYMRPQYVNIEDNIYTFDCTLRQAENYFFKFGEDAEIISPPSLRNSFFKKYKQAYNRYIEMKL